MSRTKRKNGWQDWYGSLEGYVKRDNGWFYNSGLLQRPTFEEYKKKWNKYSRDGANYEGSSRKAYREFTNELIRNKTKHRLHDIMKDPEAYEDMTFPTKWDGKFIAWCIW